MPSRPASKSTRKLPRAFARSACSCSITLMGCARLVILWVLLAISFPAIEAFSGLWCDESQTINTWAQLIEEIKSSGDSVFLCPFIIQGDGCDSSGHGFDVFSSDLYITCDRPYSLTGNTECIINCPGRHFTVHPTASLTLDGMTLKGADHSAVVAMKNSTLTTFNSIFQNNTELSGRGGAIQALEDSSLSVWYSHFFINRALVGGSIYQLGGALIQGSNFYKNTAETGSGGAIFSGQHSETVIDDGVFERNSAFYFGPAVFDGSPNPNPGRESAGCENNSMNAEDCDGTYLSAIESCFVFETTCKDSPNLFSNFPVNKPTHAPTVLPTPRPSAFPSSPPTLLPSPSPSAAPSAQPYSTPSRAPTFRPTSEPSSMSPSAQPYSNPSRAPTFHPIPEPSTSPTSKPSVLPTQMPTVMPITTPSLNPSNFPTTTPFVLPSSRPSLPPTSAPSRSPERTPSASPNALPINHPTNRHRASIAPQPAVSTGSNRVQRSFSPVTTTKDPSSHPISSGFPSVSPSFFPSSLSLDGGTMLPSSVPNFFSSIPSNMPSAGPSIAGENEPRLPARANPSPTFGPTVHFTHEASAFPSTETSSMPSSVPSTDKSDFPSIGPTINQDLSSTSPIYAPSISFAPTMMSNSDLDESSEGVLSDKLAKSLISEVGKSSKKKKKEKKEKKKGSDDKA